MAKMAPPGDPRGDISSSVCLILGSAPILVLLHMCACNARRAAISMEEIQRRSRDGEARAGGLGGGWGGVGVGGLS